MSMEPYIDITENVRKKLIHDLTPCGTAGQFMSALGMVPGSPEVEEMEHAASHRRLNRTGPINDALKSVAGLAGNVLGRCILENQGIEPTDEMVMVYEQVARAASQSVIANLIEMDMIHLGGHQ